MLVGKCALFCSAASGLIVALAGQALAQSQDSGATAGAQTPLPEIVVTAQKHSQSISNVGMSITALSGDQLKELGVHNLNDMVKIEPSFILSESQYGTPVYTIRGVGFNDFSLAASPTVSVYQDEVPYSLVQLSKGASFDLNRVEILKGPQGTLFGENATGGAVNYIAAKPTDHYAGGLEASYGSYGAYNVNGFVSGPITGTLKGRLAFDVDEGGAWQKSYTTGARLGSKDLVRGRFLLDWQPTSDLHITANLNGFTDHSETEQPQIFAIALQVPSRASTLPQIAHYPLSPLDPRAADWYGRPHNDEWYYQGAIRADYTLSPALVLTYLGSYEHYRQNDLLENNGFNLEDGFLDGGTAHSTSQELRASGVVAGGKLTYVAGADYERTPVLQNGLYDTANATAAYGLVGLGAPGPFSGYNVYSHSVNEQKALYGNLEYHLTGQLSVHAGVRHSWSDISYSGCTQSIDENFAVGATLEEAADFKAHGITTPLVPAAVGGCITLGTNFVPEIYQANLNQQNTPWRVGIDYKITPRTLVYASASEGFKAGSFPTIAATTSGQLLPVSQESLIAYEVGAKSRPLGNLLDLTAAVFYYEYNNKQVYGRAPVAPFGILSKLVNIPQSHEIGAELAFTLRPFDDFTVNGSGTYLHSKITNSGSPNYDSYGDVVSYDGERFPNTPDWSLNIGAQYKHKLIDAVQFYIGGDVHYQSSEDSVLGTEQAVALGKPSLELRPYTLLNLRAGVTSKDGRWRAEVFGQNVFNTYYWTYAEKTSDTLVRYAGMPATFGVTVGYRY